MSSLDWKPKQKLVARYLAIGYTQEMAARAVGYSERQVGRLIVDPAFTGLVQQLHERLWSRLEPEIVANMLLAVDVQRRMFLGEINPSDGRYRAAERLLNRILERLLVADPARAAATPTAAVQVNVNPAGPGSVDVHAIDAPQLPRFEPPQVRGAGADGGGDGHDDHPVAPEAQEE